VLGARIEVPTADGTVSMTVHGLVFDEAGEARITLIRELRQELMVSDDALEVVLSLLDQLYATRRVLKRVEEAVAALPERLRAQIRARLRPSDTSS
jgi:chaperone modulatory protein CbpM